MARTAAEQQYAYDDLVILTFELNMAQLITFVMENR